MPIPLDFYLVVAALLFALGLFGALRRTNTVLMLMAIELMLNAVNINLVAFSRHLPDAVPGQIFAIFIITVAAAEAAVGLAIILLLVRRRNTVDVSKINSLKG